MMSIKSGAKVVISSENDKHSPRFFILHADFCFYIVGSIKNNYAIPVHLPYHFDGIACIFSLRLDKKDQKITIRPSLYKAAAFLILLLIGPK